MAKDNLAHVSFIDVSGPSCESAYDLTYGCLSRLIATDLLGRSLYWHQHVVIRWMIRGMWRGDELGIGGSLRFLACRDGQLPLTLTWCRGVENRDEGGSRAGETKVCVCVMQLS
jgi:hypothetical protein